MIPAAQQLVISITPDGLIAVLNVPYRGKGLLLGQVEVRAMQPTGVPAWPALRVTGKELLEHDEPVRQATVVPLTFIRGSWPVAQVRTGTVGRHVSSWFPLKLGKGNPAGQLVVPASMHPSRKSPVLTLTL
jgi:hypothetical protein